jgi:hypothetical protein
MASLAGACSSSSNAPAGSATRGMSATPATTAAGVALLTATGMLVVADLPAGWHGEPPAIGSGLADPSNLSATCSPQGGFNDVGFSYLPQGTPAGLGIARPLLGEFMESYPSVEAAVTGVASAQSRVTSCTATGETSLAASITVTPQPLPASYGDQSAAYRVEVTLASSPALGYVIIARKSNLVASFFYFDPNGGDGLATLAAAAAVGAAHMGQ